MIKFSIVRRDKKNAVHLTVKTAEWFIKRIQVDTKAGDITKLREYIARFGDKGIYEDNIPVAMIYPSVEMAKTESGTLEVRAFNGLVTLHVGDLMTQEDIEAVKEASKMLPMTFAAFTGADGRSVELLVAVARKDGGSQRTEAEMNLFCQVAYDLAYSTYSGILPKAIQRQQVTARSAFRMTLDASPYFNQSPVPLMVQENRIPALASASADEASGAEEQLKVDMDLYADYELMYRRAAEETLELVPGIDGPERLKAYVTELSHRLCEMGMPAEEAFVHIRNHHVYKQIYDEEMFRAIVAAVYAESKHRGSVEGETVSQETRRLIQFLTSRYVFRFNTVMGYTEYRPNHSWLPDWMPCDENAINGITLEARLANLDVKDKDVRRYVHSNKIRTCDPIGEYLANASTKWDGVTDHIARLARTVPCDIPKWEEWFKKWFVSMVAQWIYPSPEYGNAIVPLLISPQGDGKTAFCRNLLPKELRWGFLENLDVSEKRQTLQAMHNFLIINLDEFNSISTKLQEGFLKNVIQLPSVKLKRPYGKHVEEFRRYASFIATTNEQNVLSDPTGSRRFICVNLTAPIDISYKINYEALYGQAYSLVMKSRMQWWFDAEEVKEVMAHNAQFTLTPPAIQYFNEYYEPAQDEATGKWLSPTAIYDHLRKIAGSGLKANGVQIFGRYLWNMDGLKHRRVGGSRQYLVSKKP